MAVWSYVITFMREDKTVGVQVELRPDLLAFYIGEKQEDVEKAIAFHCKPDPDSTCQEEEGRRLVSVGKFSYRVVSGPEYIKIRNEADLREYRRIAKRKERSKKKGKTLPGENLAVAADKRGDHESFDNLASERKV